MKYYKLNVPYPVGVRFFIGDAKGKVLTERRDPYVGVEDDKVRDFKRANYYGLTNGLIVETDEPSLDYESPNMIDDEKAAEIVKNIFVLKKALVGVTTPAVVNKLLKHAKAQKRPSATIKVIENKLLEIDETIEDVNMMGGVE